ncbi:MAG: glycosyltransferase [Oscillospiraceae bacterium]|nr:glycosyltransferase [Oscillospiraceae bacterium]
MKYLFINSVAGYGSTGRIAAETCRELMKEGHECVLAFGRTREGFEDVPTVQIGSPMDYKFHALQSRILDNSGFGSQAATRKFLQWVREYDPDVIWMHNLHGYYIHLGELFAYLRTCGKEIRWTLHDCWSFTGHCAYFDFVRCSKWKTQCSNCPQKGSYPASMLKDNSFQNYKRKKALFTGIPNMTLTVPSYWLEKRVKESFLKEYPVEVVYNTVDQSVFRPLPSQLRQQYGLEDKKIILGVASVWDARKGLEDMKHLAQLLDDSYRCVAIGLSAEQMKNLPERMLGLPRTKSVEELVQWYTAADVFVNPSKEETFGMTPLEAHCCGTPAVVYQDTACEEIAEAFGGIAVAWGAEHLCDAVRKITMEESE